MSADELLFANTFRTEQTFVLDLTRPASPRIVSQIGDVGAMRHPHRGFRLANGNRLEALQMQHDSVGMAPDGLAEISKSGAVVRHLSDDRPGVDRRIRPHSFQYYYRLRCAENTRVHSAIRFHDRHAET